MLKIKVTNHRGESMVLNGNASYTVTRITGLNPPNANINTLSSANTDGSTFTNSKVNERNIVFTIVIEPKVEQNRINLYKFFKVKKACTLQFTNKSRKVYINGYIESFECDFFSERETAQISIMCPQPYFIDTESTLVSFSNTTPLAEFPLDILEAGIELSEALYTQSLIVTNKGDVETGMTITIKATAAVEEPMIRNIQTGDYFQLTNTLSAGDILTINTVRGQKSVTITSGGTTTNAINYREKSSTWLQLESGDNFFICDATSGAAYMQCNITYNALFEGI